MKKVFFLLFAAMFVTCLEAQAARCGRCGGSGWYRIPNVGYGLNDVVMGTCPNCNKYVNKLGHSCRCALCSNQTGGSGSSSGSSRRSGDNTPVNENAVYIMKCLQMNAIPESQPCWACGGTGACTGCKGSGYIVMGMNMNPCPACSMTRKCRTCGGNRTIQGYRPMTPEERQRYTEALKQHTK